MVNAAAIYPKFLDIGGYVSPKPHAKHDHTADLPSFPHSNTGTTNTFTGLNVTDLTAGVYNADTLLEGNNFACLAYQFSAQAKPDIVLAEIDQLTDVLGTFSSQLACPQLETIDTDQLEQFPGYVKSEGTAAY